MHTSCMNTDTNKAEQTVGFKKQIKAKAKTKVLTDASTLHVRKKNIAQLLCLLCVIGVWVHHLP